MEVAELGTKSKDELLVLARDVGIADGPNLDNLRREDLLSRVYHAASAQQSLVSSGILEVMDEGYGFLRQIISHGGTGFAPPKRENAISDWSGWKKSTEWIAIRLTLALGHNLSI